MRPALRSGVTLNITIVKHTQHYTLFSHSFSYLGRVLMCFTMVLGTRIELVFPPWKGSVLTDRRTEQILAIFQHTTSPRDSNPLSLVVYHEFYAQASNALKYNFSLRFLSQDCGLLSPCCKIVRGVVSARTLHDWIFNELAAQCRCTVLLSN